jgi:hypothetical protein
MPETTDWYFGVTCAKCNSPIMLFEDKSHGVVQFAGGGKLRVTCPKPECREQHDYGTDDVKNFQVSRR